LILSLAFIPAVSYEFAATAQEQRIYVCPMHPEITSSTEGRCPRCEMKLVPKEKAAAQQAPPAANPKPEVETALDGYTCSMHPDVRSETAGKCPKCEMPLVAVIPAINEYFNLQVECQPANPKPNDKVRLRFTIFNPKTGERVKDFLVLHEQLFHLFVVSQDMTEFQHIHPDFQKDGSFVIETVLPKPGQYKIYSDFYPADGTPQVLQANLSTAGAPVDLFSAQPSLVPDTTLSKTVDGLKIDLKLDPEEIIAGRPVSLIYTLSDAKTGEPVRDLVPYLGAWGHTLILSEDQSDYVHSHPEEALTDAEGKKLEKGGPTVTFSALMPRPGRYRIWSQFQRGDRLTTVSFTVKAERLR
jgi:hypothetical protein